MGELTPYTVGGLLALFERSHGSGCQELVPGHLAEVFLDERALVDAEHPKGQQYDPNDEQERRIQC
jgi:hypothetical protein